MLPLKHERFWRIADLALILLVFFFALIPAAWFWHDTVNIMAWSKHSDKLLHGFTFVALSVWFGGQYRPRSYWKIAAGLMLCGIVIELCQFTVSYRSADWYDIGANTLGIIVGLSMAVAGLGGWSLRAEEWLAARAAGSRG
jgi:glycopeptide antibiotics resistance protein